MKRFEPVFLRFAILVIFLSVLAPFNAIVSLASDATPVPPLVPDIVATGEEDGIPETPDPESDDEVQDTGASGDDAAAPRVASTSSLSTP